ncbi:hypothetical protein AB0D04_05975 [Streptomyces sp. NPDC048483]
MVSGAELSRGRYAFTAATPASGTLRPLRDPDAVELDDDDEGAER